MKATASRRWSGNARDKRTLLLHRIVAPLACFALIACTLAPSATSTSEPPVEDRRQAATPVSRGLLHLYAERFGREATEAEGCGPQAAWEEASRDLVAVDAIAKTDARVLLEQLSSVGLRHGQIVAPVVSGRLPICAIPNLITCCSELHFVRESTAATRQ